MSEALVMTVGGHYSSELQDLNESREFKSFSQETFYEAEFLLPSLLHLAHDHVRYKAFGTIDNRSPQRRIGFVIRCPQIIENDLYSTTFIEMCVANDVMR